MYSTLGKYWCLVPLFKKNINAKWILSSKVFWRLVYNQFIVTGMSPWPAQGNSPQAIRSSDKPFLALFFLLTYFSRLMFSYYLYSYYLHERTMNKFASRISLYIVLNIVVSRSWVQDPRIFFFVFVNRERVIQEEGLYICKPIRGT